MSQVIGSTSAAFTRTWHHINLQDEILGKVAARIALILMGKHKPVYDPGVDCGDYVVVTNARHVQVTGKKDKQKLYRYHTGWKLKEIPFFTMMEKHPDQIIRKAVSGMLPKNKLRDRRLERLKICLDNEKTYERNYIKRYDVPKSTSQVGLAMLDRKSYSAVEQLQNKVKGQ